MKKSLIIVGLIAMVLSFWSCNNYGTKLTFDDMELYYTDQVTEEQAQEVGELLQELDLTTGGERSAQITKEGGTYQFRMVVLDGHEDDPEVKLLAEVLIENLSVSVFDGDPVEVHICDENLETISIID